MLLAMSWNSPVPYEHDLGSQVASDPDVILRAMDRRGIRLRGLEPDKLRLRLKICVKRELLSLTQSVAVWDHLTKK